MFEFEVNFLNIVAKLEFAPKLEQGKRFSQNDTSLEICILLVLKSKTLYPFVFKGYPTKMCYVDLGSNLSLWTVIKGKQRHPKYLR